MSELFSVRLSVRVYELDSNRHVNAAVYLRYAEHARWEMLRSAGVDEQVLGRAGVGPVFLETVIKYRSELLYGDEIDVTCAIEWSEGKTFKVPQEIRKTDGVLVAEITSVGGLIDQTTRRLIPRPDERYRVIAPRPAALGL